jgi:anti-sigma regulatory factor (Ser/Thr protein kinase)
MPYYRCPACGAMSHSVAAYSTAGVCAVCAAPLPDDAKLEVLPHHSVALSRKMRAGLAAPAQARRAVTSLPFLEATRERLALVVSELVTNSIRHAGLGAGDPIDLDVTSVDGHVRIAVHDDGPGFDPAPHAGEAPANGGFGLALVAALSAEWGVERHPDGCTVWCAVQA